MGGWWGRLWIWATLALLIALAVAMMVVGSSPLVRIWRALESSEAPSALTEKRLDDLLSAAHLWLLTLIGGGGVAAILWLMLFKPF